MPSDTVLATLITAIVSGAAYLGSLALKRRAEKMKGKEHTQTLTIEGADRFQKNLIVRIEFLERQREERDALRDQERLVHAAEAGDLRREISQLTLELQEIRLRLERCEERTSWDGRSERRRSTA